MELTGEQAVALLLFGDNVLTKLKTVRSEIHILLINYDQLKGSTNTFFGNYLLTKTDFLNISESVPIFFISFCQKLNLGLTSTG